MVRLTQKVTVTQLTASNAAANCAATVPLISLSETLRNSGKEDLKESLYTFERNVPYNTINMTGVINEEKTFFSILIICLLLSDHQISIRALYGQIGFSITKYINVSGFFVVQICLQFSTCRGVFDLSTFFR